MALQLTHRCWNHGERLAVARCASCQKHYCRECVAEHDGRMLCSRCLAAPATASTRSRPWLAALSRAARTAAAVFIAWMFFQSIGWMLLRIPSSFHEGTLWKDAWWEEGGQP